LTFGKVILFHENTEHDPFGVLLMLLVSVVHHAQEIMEVIEKDPVHPFSKIPLMSSPLLFELNELCLTFELNNHVLKVKEFCRILTISARLMK
jgi:hypothetical protein